MPKYNLGITNRFKEHMEITQCDSFDQAASYLEKEVYRRELLLAKRLLEKGLDKEVPADLIKILRESGDYQPNHKQDANQGDSAKMDEGNRKK